MKSLFIVALAALALSACSTVQPMAGSAQTDSLVSAGTLAFAGTCEMDVAADYSATTLYRKRAARDLTRGTLTVDTAQKVQALADSARADLDAACPNRQATLNVAHRDQARATLAAIAKLLEKKP